jgi:hypothetical protein
VKTDRRNKAVLMAKCWQSPATILVCSGVLRALTDSVRIVESKG